MRPRKLSKLKSVVARLQRSDEENETLVGIISKWYPSRYLTLLTDDVEHEADEPMMCSKW